MYEPAVTNRVRVIRAVAPAQADRTDLAEGRKASKEDSGPWPTESAQVQHI